MHGHGPYRGGSMWQKSKFVDQPLAWTGLATMLTAWIWPYVEPNWVHCALGSVGMFFLGFQNRDWSLSWIPTICGVILFSLAMLSDRTSEPRLTGSVHSHGTVLDRVGRYGLVEAPEGRFFLRFSDDGPKKGASIVFWATAEEAARGWLRAWDVAGHGSTCRRFAAQETDVGYS